MREVTLRSDVDIQGYLSRIGYGGDVSPTPGVLGALQAAHLLSVPFENLDIHAGRRIVLDPASLFEKIVRKQRGGFCYELNGLFHRLLLGLGFPVKLVMGRVYDRERDAYGPEFDHMLILAEMQAETFLVDVGFGEFSLHPLTLRLDQPLLDRNGRFLIERHNGEYLRVSKFSPAVKRFVPEYIFSPEERALSDFSSMCLYHQTSPDSHFTRHKICSIATPTGRITLTDDRLIVTQDGTRQEEQLRDALEFDRALESHFKIVL